MAAENSDVPDAPVPHHQSLARPPGFRNEHFLIAGF
jgi:hypothetical protein